MARSLRPQLCWRLDLIRTPGLEVCSEVRKAVDGCTSWIMEVCTRYLLIHVVGIPDQAVVQKGAGEENEVLW